MTVSTLIFLIQARFVFRRFFVADGNFKADHVRQKHIDADIWLSEGGGMMPKRIQYQEFLQTAFETSTVCKHDLLAQFLLI
jgi:hypothetical protein